MSTVTLEKAAEPVRAEPPGVRQQTMMPDVGWSPEQRINARRPPEVGQPVDVGSGTVMLTARATALPAPEGCQAALAAAAVATVSATAPAAAATARTDPMTSAADGGQGHADREGSVLAAVVGGV